MIERPQPYDFEDDESLVDRSVSFVREISARLRQHASRRWRTTSLTVDVGILRRRRRQWLLALGDEVYFRMRRGQSVDGAELQEYYDEIHSAEQEIAAREQQIAELDEDERFDRAEDEQLMAPAPQARGRSVSRRREAGERPAAGAPLALRSPSSQATQGTGSEASEDDEEPEDEVDETPPPGVG